MILQIHENRAPLYIPAAFHITNITHVKTALNESIYYLLINVFITKKTK